MTELQKAYLMIYENLVAEENSSIFKGNFDARAKDSKERVEKISYMNGICAIMGHISYMCNKEEEFDEIWYDNINNSIEKARGEK